MTSPRIVRFFWGKVAVEGYEPFRDVMLFPGGARAWDWRKTGTRHVPGILPATVRFLLENGVETVILSSGVLGRLQVHRDTLALLKEAGVPYHIMRTGKAVRLHNRLRTKTALGTLIHSTC